MIMSAYKKQSFENVPDNEKAAENVPGDEKATENAPEEINGEDTNEQTGGTASQNEEKQENADDSAKRMYAELYDKYLRLIAEYDNFKKRTMKEKDELYAKAISDVIMKLLPVVDNFDRAEKFIDDGNVTEGFALIRKQLNEFLTKLGIAEIEAQDKEFDPNLHDAVYHEDVEGGPENTVAQVLQKGYLPHDKVLRHSMVKVIN